MLSYALAIAVALSSLVLFLTAFFMSDIHRKDDFLWSGVGLLYALILWFCARNITGTVLLGQAAASILLVSFGWQTLKLRKAIANPERASEISNFSVLQATMGLLNRKKSQPQVAETPSKIETPDKVKESKISIPDTTSPAGVSADVAETTTSQAEVKEENKNNLITENTTVETSEISSPETTEDEVKPEVEPEREKQPDTVVEKPETEIAVEEEEKLEVEPEREKQPDTVVEKSETEIAVEEEVKPEVEPEREKQPDTVVEKLETEIAVEEEEKPEVEPEREKQPDTVVEKLETEIEAAKSETTPESTTETKEDSANKIIPETTEVENEPTVVKTSPEIESKVEDTPVVQNTKTQTKEETKPSPLDSLETVEVAEVLEADPETISRETNSDRNNIIEVTTTEIEPDDQKDNSEES